MCGILCEICFRNKTPSKDYRVLKRLRNRGPNCIQTLEMGLGDSTNAFFCGAVLWMQGPQLTPQPLETQQGVLLYNGDIFDESWPSNISDTLVIMEKLNNRAGKSTEEKVLQQLKTLKGPFAIIYYDKINRKLFFMRDRIGRSTLLFTKCDNSIIISSILGRDYNCIEVPATHIQILSLSTNMIKLCPWDDELGSTEEFVVDDWIKQMRLQQSLPDDEFRFQYVEEELIEDDVVKYIESAGRQIKCKLTVMKKLLEHAVIQNTVLKVTELLERSIKLRLNRQPNKCKMCVNDESDACNHCTVGVLFSGGLDCTILALLADKYLPKEQSIDLINVAFKKDENASYDVPDRITGRQSLQELQKLCPTRKWVFREVNVPKEELEKYQEDSIGDLVYPRQTILDESLGSALWFAARGQDCAETSSSRWVLVQMNCLVDMSGIKMLLNEMGG